MTEIRSARGSDWLSIAEIYREGIESGDATFETEVPTQEAWEASRHSACRLVAEDDGTVVGFAMLSPVSSRAVYSGVGEVMVYVEERSRGRGVGTALLDALVRCSEETGFWTLEAGIFPENDASVRAHRRVGFRIVGTRYRIGRFHEGTWRDTVLMARRSDRVGLD